MNANARGRALVKLWATRFGLGAFDITVSEADPTSKDGWAFSEWNLNEQWARIELPADGVFVESTLRLLVLHELTHGMLLLAGTGETAEEQVCNRIARLAGRDWKSPLPDRVDSEKPRKVTRAKRRRA